jgi:hypothetical protein
LNQKIDHLKENQIITVAVIKVKTEIDDLKHAQDQEIDDTIIIIIAEIIEGVPFHAIEITDTQEGARLDLGPEKDIIAIVTIIMAEDMMIEIEKDKEVEIIVIEIDQEIAA